METTGSIVENTSDGENANYFILLTEDDFEGDDDFESSIDSSGDYGDQDRDNKSTKYSDDDSVSKNSDNHRGDNDNDNTSDDKSRNEKFNIQEKIYHLLKSTSLLLSSTGTDIESLPLFDGSRSTVKEFSSKIISHCRSHNVSSAFITQIFQTFTDFLPSFNEDSLITSSGNKQLQIHEIENNVHQYPNTIHILTFDVCIKGCMVYTNPTLRQCNCGKRRYRPCTTCSRQNHQLSTLSEDICQHQNRIPYKQLKYRSITLLLVELLKFDSFRKLIKYKWRNKSPMETRDISDRIKYSANLEAMHQTYEEHCQSKDSHDVIEVSILLSWFYDGIQLFGKKTSTFQPLLLTILNLPPNIRHEIGLGTFLLAFCLYKEDSEVEKFLLQDCLLEELLVLNKGIAINIGGVEYFLQARLINHILDLKALCPILKFQPFQSSKAGCKLCNIGSGTSIYFGGERNVRNFLTKYIDSRSSLPTKHYLRSSGLSRNCCPKIDENTSLFNLFEKITIPNTTNQNGYYNKNEVDPDNLVLCFESILSPA